MKSLFTALLVLVLAASLFADPFNKGDKIAQVGIGYGFAFYTGSGGIPPISLGFQYGLEKKISIGGIIGYTSSTEKWGWHNDNWEWKYTYIIIGARGEYHFLEDSENIDAYAGLTLGYYIVSVTTPAGYNDFGYSTGASSALFGAHVGARYYFSPKFAAFGELGYGVGYITVGVAFKL